MDYNLIKSCEVALRDDYDDINVYNFYGDENGQWVVFGNSNQGIVVATGTYKAIDTFKEFDDNDFDKASKRFKREIELMFDSF